MSLFLDKHFTEVEKQMFWEFLKRIDHYIIGLLKKE